MEATTVRQDLWELATVIAMERLGIVPLRRIDGKCQPPRPDLARMEPDEARKAKRRYRKLWRRDLARELREFERTPKRRKKDWHYSGAYVNGSWKSVQDPLECFFIKIEAVEAGSDPTAYGRSARWSRVKDGPEFRRMLMKVAAELGLLHPKRSM